MSALLCKKLLLFSLLAAITVFVRVSEAKETWIDIAGIDPFNSAQNYTEIYQNSADFSAACRMKSDRSCERYIDTSISRAGSANEAEETGFSKGSDLKGSLGKEAYLKRLQEIISHSSQGDKLVISLTNHGTTPPKEQGGRSCILINNFECISEQDLRRVLTGLPRGVDVAIVANGCFSGAFADLANSNICVVTAADQYHTGSAGSIKLWKDIKSGKIKKLADFSKKSYLESDTRLGSENMAANNCAQLRQEIGETFSEQDLKKIEEAFQKMYDGALACQSYPGSYFLMNFGNTLFSDSKFQELASKVCSSKNQESVSQCRLLKRANQNEDLKKKLLEDYATAELLARYSADMKKNGNKLAGARPEVAREMIRQMNAALDRESWFGEPIGKFSKEEQQAIQEFVIHFKSDLEKYEGAGDKLRRKSLSLTQGTVDSDQVMALRRCLLQARFEAPSAAAESLPLRQFTPKEISDAKKCEAKFSF